ncbi:MAG: outer membrane lipoprotein LolB [Francisella sp.]|jgi:outer membrane lipoprotein LolB
MQLIMSKLRIDIKRQVRIAFIVIALFVLSSCQSLSVNNSTEINKSTKFDITALEAKLQKLNKWDAKGVIGIRYNGKADSANYVYSQNGDDFSIKLYGPLGIGSIEIKGNDKEAVFVDNKGKKTQANNVESLMMHKLGWFVPVEGLKNWIKGIPVSDKDTDRHIDNNNLTQVLLEKGWKIDYHGYKMFDDQYPLPTKIKMTRDDLSLKIIIKSWQV